MYAKVTDGAVTRFYDLNSRSSKARYNELINNNTGYNVVVDQTGAVKEFTEEQVKTAIDAAQTAANKKPKKEAAPSNKQVFDEE